METTPFILIAEDDPDYVFLIKEALFDISHNNRCLFFENGEEILKFLKQNKVLPSLIITDISMPKVNGFEVLREVREDMFFSQIPVAFFSHSSDSGDKNRAAKLNCNGYYTKGSCAKEMGDALSSMLALMN